MHRFLPLPLPRALATAGSAPAATLAASACSTSPAGPNFHPAAAPRRRRCALVLLNVAALGLAWGLAPSAQAAPEATPAAARTARPNVPQSPVRVSDAWVRWLPSQLPAAGYMVLENTGARPLDLVDIDSPDYAEVMLHRTVRNGSTTTMEMAQALTLPPHEKVAIAPGGYHLMLEKPTRAIAPGATVEWVLRFSDGTTMRMRVPVSAPTRTQ